MWVTKVMKRHPRRAVWLGRLGDYGVAILCGIFALVFGAMYGWDVSLGWGAAMGLAISYEGRLANVWSWAWHDGMTNAVDILMPLVDVDALDSDQLRALHTAPTWRQTKDRQSQIDHRATLRAGLAEIERARAGMEDH